MDMRVQNRIFRAGMLLTVLLASVVLISDAWSMSSKPQEPEYASGEILVSFNEGTSQERIEQIVAGEKSTIRKVIGRGGVHIVDLPGGVEVMDAVDRFSAYPEVKYAEPNYKAQRLEK